MAIVALSPDGTVLNGANGALRPEHATLGGVWCSRMCFACTDALLRFGLTKYTLVEAPRERGVVPQSSRESRLSAARVATHQCWRPLMEEMRQELAAANEPGT